MKPEMMTDPMQPPIMSNRPAWISWRSPSANCHGLYKFPPKLDVQRLIAIRKKVSIPVVLHGGSDTPVQMAKDVIANGVTKFNIGTDLKYAYARKLKETMNTEPMPYQPPAVMGPAREAVCAVAREKMQLFNSSGKAGLYSK